MFNGKEFTQFFIKDNVENIYTHKERGEVVQFLKTGIVLPKDKFDQPLEIGQELILSFEETDDNQESFRNLWQTCSYYICDKNGNYEVDLPYTARPNKIKKKKK